MNVFHVNLSAGGIGIYGKALDSSLRKMAYKRCFSFLFIKSWFLSALKLCINAIIKRPEVIIDSAGKCDVKSMLVCFIISRVIFAKYVVVEHDPKTHSGMNYSNKKVKLISWILKRADEVIVHGDECEKDFFKINKFHAKVIPHINLDLFKTKQATDGKKNKDVLNIIFFGALRPNKGVELLPQVVDELDNLGVNYKLKVAGSDKLSKELMEGPWAKELKTVLGTLANKEHVDLDIGFIENSEVDKYFSNSDIVLLPYKDATQSGVLSLALTYKKPVVATSVGDLGLTVSKYNLGLICNYDYREIALCLSNFESGSYTDGIEYYCNEIVSDDAIAKKFSELLESLYES